MSEKPKILIVDDEVRNRILLEDICISMGYDTLQADDGTSALAMMSQQLPDLVLLDIMMPQMNGLEVLERISDNSKLKHMPVIVVTALDEINHAVKCIEKGAIDYLPKPFNITVLSARIKNSIEKKIAQDQQDHLSSLIKTNYDILLLAEKTRDTLSHMIVHDINTALTVIHMNTELILLKDQDKKQLDATSAECLKTIQKSVGDITMLTSSMLDISKIENGEMPVNICKVEVISQLKKVMSEYLSISKNKSICLNLHHNYKQIYINADVYLFLRIIKNLVSNAFKFARTNISITCSFKEGGNKTVISIVDDGPGIPTKYLTKVFEKYFQIEMKKNKKSYGVGLGLAFCKLAVEAQGGEIWAKSEEGEGASFHVSFQT